MQVPVLRLVLVLELPWAAEAIALGVEPVELPSGQEPLVLRERVQALEWVPRQLVALQLAWEPPVLRERVQAHLLPSALQQAALVSRLVLAVPWQVARPQVPAMLVLAQACWAWAAA